MNELKVSIIIPNKRNGWELLTLISSIVLHENIMARKLKSFMVKRNCHI